MLRTQQRRQAGQHRGGKRCAGRCRDAGSEGRRVEFVIGRQHQGDADRLAGVRAAVPGAGKAFCDRRRHRQGWRRVRPPASAAASLLQPQATPLPCLGSGRSRGQPGPASKAPPRPAAGPSLKAGSSKAAGIPARPTAARRLPPARRGMKMPRRRGHDRTAVQRQLSRSRSAVSLRPMRSRFRQPRPPGGHARAARAGLLRRQANRGCGADRRGPDAPLSASSTHRRRASAACSPISRSTSSREIQADIIDYRGILITLIKIDGEPGIPHIETGCEGRKPCLVSMM